MENIVKASPTKEFFVNMLVKDILLKQAIIELIDNSIDGAKNLRKDNKFSGLEISLNFNDTRFEIQDNCGGIPLNVAADYAFRFGRPLNAKTAEAETTGIFGIGMKRALFKMGREIFIQSTTQKTSFEINLDVDEWMNKDDNNWDFEFSSFKEGLDNPEEKTGTKIIVKSLYEEIAQELSDEEFEKELIEYIQYRIGLDIDYGIYINVNGKSVNGNYISLIDNENIKPLKEEYEDGDVAVKILCGIAPRDGRTYPPEKAGWYIYCNDRLVVAADKTSLTTWKDINNKNNGVVFHNSYAGFRGMVCFNSKYPEKLPWNTTKTGLDEISPVYLRAKPKMLELFKIIKGTLDNIKNNTGNDDNGMDATISEMEGTNMTVENVNHIVPNRELDIKNITLLPDPPVSISYKKAKSEVNKLKGALGVKSNKEVGEKTFEYYLDAEC